MKMNIRSCYYFT